MSDIPSDSPGVVTEVPADADPLDALEALEAGELASQDPTPRDATPTDSAPASAPQQVEQPSVPADQAAQTPGQEEAWLEPGKFRTVDDLRAAYAALETEKGRQAREIGELRAAQAAPPQTQQAQPQQPGLPSLPSYNHPQAGYTPEQLEQLQYDNPAQLADYIASVRAAEMFGQLVPALAPMMDAMDVQQARNVVDSLRRTYGDDVVTRHSPALAEMLQQDEGYFLPEGTRTQRFAQALEALEYRHMIQQSQAQPRAADGTFAAKPDPAPVHVEPGSTGAPAPASTQPTVAPEVAQMREYGGNMDRFGGGPPGVPLRRQATTRA